MAFKDHFSRLAAQYAAFRPTYPEPLFDYLAELCPRRDSVWDCACGNGQATVPLATRFRAVAATDASASQIEHATPRPNVQYRVGGAEHSGLEADSRDLVTVAQALHWLNLPAFYAEVERVLAKDGVLAVWCYGVVHVDGADVDAPLQRFYNDVVGPYWPPERRYVEEGYRSLPFPYPQLTSPALDMVIDWTLKQLLGYLRSWSATGRYVQEHGSDPVLALEKELEKRWGNRTTPRHARWPLSLRVGRK